MDSDREADRRPSALDEEVAGDVISQDDGVARGPDEPHSTGTDAQFHLGASRDRGVLESGDEPGIRLDRLSDAADDGSGGLTAGDALHTDLIGGGPGVFGGLRRDGVAEGVGGDVVEDDGQALLDLFAHHVLPTAGLRAGGPCR